MSVDIRKQALAAAAREQQLVEAIYQRGQQQDMEPGRVGEAIDEARAEIRRRGQSFAQILGDLPVEPIECCADCFEWFMDHDDTDIA